MFAAALQSGCGDSDTGSDDIQGHVVEGSRFAAMVLAAVNVDPSIRTSRIYRYDFASGVVQELLPGESGNPAVFAAGDQVLLFNRQSDAEKTLRVIDGKSSESEPGAPKALGDLADGDPLDVVPLRAGATALLASGLGARLQVLDIAAATLSDVDTTALAGDAVRPVALHKSGDNVFVAHSGLTDLTASGGDSDGSQQLFVAQATGDSLTWSDQKPATSEVDGLPLTASNPFGLVNRSDGGALVVGLCAEDSGACVAGADRLTSGAVAALATYGDDFGYRFFNRIVDGPDSSTVYAHVTTAGNRYLVVKLNAQTKATTIVHEHPDERLYGLAYDTSSKTLFVGGIDGLKGTLTLYRDDVVAGQIELAGVPYSAAFVPK